LLHKGIFALRHAHDVKIVGGSRLSAEQRRQARKMYDERELTVEQIGRVLGVSRTSIDAALADGSDA
jgi:DNA-binding transcriptional regulator LsrR (DeoR family)